MNRAYAVREDIAAMDGATARLPKGRTRAPLRKGLTLTLAMSRLLALTAALLVCGTSAGSDGPPPDTTGGDAPSTPLPSDPVCPSSGAVSPLASTGAPRSETVAAGSIAGAFSASPTGEASYTMPLTLPPGRGGMTPSLAVSYDSGGGNGLLGMGFSIQGLSSITRCPKNMAQDGEIQAVRYDESDRYCLDGRRLVLVEFHGSSDITKATLEYRTFPDSFAKVIAHFDADQAHGPSAFVAYLKSGVVMEYGTEASGLVIGPNGHRRSWWVSRIRDRRSNEIAVTYENDIDADDGHTKQHAPAKIAYVDPGDAASSRAVWFDYEKKDARDQRILHAGGVRLESSWLLGRIRMVGPHESAVREYRFGYGKNETATHRTLLQQIEECGADGVCKPPMRFTWHHGVPGWTQQPTHIAVPDSPSGGAMFMDVTGDGLDDLVTSDQNVPFSPGGYDGLVLTDWEVAVNAGASASAWLSTPALWAEDGHFGDYTSGFQPEVGTPIDYDQDGLMDVFVHDVYGAFTSWSVLLAQPDRTFHRVDTGIYRPFGATGIPGLTRSDGAAHLADVNGDGVATSTRRTARGASTRKPSATARSPTETTTMIEIGSSGSGRTAEQRTFRISSIAMTRS